MRVTLASARTSASVNVAASFAFSEPVRSEPGITRIFSAGIIQRGGWIAVDWPDRVSSTGPYQPLRYTQTRAGGRFIQIRSEASVDTPGSDFGIGGATE